MDWRNAADYAELLTVERLAFAWEWLRRTRAYRLAWNAHGSLGHDSLAAQQFFLERFENPDIPTPWARPLWSARIDPSVLSASVINIQPAAEDRIDLHALSDLVSIAIDHDDIEHLLLSDGRHAVRVDIIDGTLIGCPASVRYHLEGLASASPKTGTLRKLINLVRDKRFSSTRPRSRHLIEKWVRELRTADALETGASQQDIARALFGGLVADRDWRTDSWAYRRRTQRLVNKARSRLLTPIDQQWFGI